MWNRREIMQAALLPLASPLAGAGSNDARSGLIAFRIGIPLWLTEDRFQELLAFFAKRAGAVDELVFFTSGTHPPLPLEEMERRAERLAAILPRVRAAGMKAGINILATMGHHEENQENSLNAPWQRVTDPWGKQSAGSFCPAQPELLDYAREIYTLMGKAGPDILWIDDDVRLAGHKPITYTCFCDLCMRNFSKEVGRQFSRDTLVAAFDSGPLQQRLALRRQWLQHNRGVINQLFRQIEQATHAVKPDLSLGLMTGDRFYEGYDFEGWAKTLAGPRNVEVRWRPGGGFYSDETLLGMVDKANAMGRQVAALPGGIKVIQSELENFPYQRLRKSANTTVVEAACHMAAGTTGTAFNVLTMTSGKVEEYLPLYARIADFRPFYERLQSELGRSLARGVWPAWNRDSFITVNADGKWLSGGRMPLGEMYTLGEIGIPLCYDKAGAALTALSGSGVLAFSEDELRQIFSRGVLMDVAAWQALRELGLEKWTGVEAVEGIDRDASEVLTNDPANTSFSGWGRDCRQSFWWERAYRLQASNPNARTLARLTDYGGRDLGPSLLAHTNELGGRVAVVGYYPWTQIHSLAKSSQVKALCQWLSGERLPVLVDSFSKVTVWYRDGAKGAKAMVVLNASLDPVARLALRIHGEGSRFLHVRSDGTEQAVATAPGSDGYTKVEMSDLAPWTIHLLLQRRTA